MPGLTRFILIACTRGGNHHLNQFISHYAGQNAVQLGNQLDLGAMGFKPLSNPFRQQHFSARLFSGYQSSDSHIQYDSAHFACCTKAHTLKWQL